MSNDNLIELDPEDLKINLTPQADRYIKEKKISHITVSLVEIGGGWNSKIRPAAQVLKPDDKIIDKFVKKVINGTNIYFARNLEPKNHETGITIDAQGFWIFKKLKLQGVKPH